MPWSVGRVYINTHMAEHWRHYRHGQSEKSAVPEYVLSSEGHTAMFEEVLFLMRRYFPRLQMEAIEIFKHGVLQMNERD